MELYIKLTLISCLYSVGVPLCLYYTKHRKNLNLEVLFNNNRVLVLFMVIAFIIPPVSIYISTCAIFTIVKREYYDMKIRQSIKSFENFSNDLTEFEEEIENI